MSNSSAGACGGRPPPCAQHGGPPPSRPPLTRRDRHAVRMTPRVPGPSLCRQRLGAFAQERDRPQGSSIRRVGRGAGAGGRPPTEISRKFRRRRSWPGGSHLRRGLLSTSDQRTVCRPIIWSRMKSRHSGAAGQIRRRHSGAVGRLRRSTPGRPANRSGDGARVDLAGATMEWHMRPCRRPWAVHATNYESLSVVAVAVRLARPPRARGLGKGRGRKREERGEREVSLRGRDRRKREKR